MKLEDYNMKPIIEALTENIRNFEEYEVLLVLESLTNLPFYQKSLNVLFN